MNTLTKEWLQNTITSIESARDEIPFGLDEDQNNMLTALKIALASLAAVSDERAAYELFMEKRFGESVDRRRAKNGDREYMAWDMALGWIIWCHRAAMLQGSQPVSQTYKSQHTQFEQVADLYEMQFDDGRTCAFHTDAQKAAQWLQACDGNRVQEYVKLERLRNALSGNSPGTPDSWISCSDRMPEKGQNVLISVNFDSSLVEPLICSARYTGSTFRRGDATIKPGNGIEQATHWMPLPEPPQEVK
ncbi:DUF551 domain-containing protein [Escherichia coli]|uniref:DUF551 domain-containing protein n=1 Tax=Escherichia coli TaxID=562 RepID=UPI002090CBD4|nr:DUF551 domain-containing protein [Escherichia coli]MCO4900787.1 DUF551 domain-containing protein [Escherichia coli]